MAKEQAAMEWCVEANEGNSFSDSVRDKNPRVVMPSTAKSPSCRADAPLLLCWYLLFGCCTSAFSADTGSWCYGI